ncbi:MAG: pyridoxal-5-phosphate-dependent protein subunit beta, partial [Spirochaetaceae bacterium]|nr:pyridoxal-5-phosphate-dependent protein subunit beta [Spirochaetaceae bacterium]
EGIGDKHVPWVHNVKDTDMVAAIDDEHTMRLLRLFNEPVGRDYLASRSVKDEVLKRLDWLGVSSICNMLTAVKMAKYYELTEDDVVMTVFTDSEAMYTSRLAELTAERGAYTRDDAVADYEMLQQLGIDSMLEFRYEDKKRVHNLKYYTWVEQQGKTYDEINAQWYNRDYWECVYAARDELDRMIVEFNNKVESYR